MVDSRTSLKQKTCFARVFPWICDVFLHQCHAETCLSLVGNCVSINTWNLVIHWNPTSFWAATDCATEPRFTTRCKLNLGGRNLAASSQAGLHLNIWSFRQIIPTIPIGSMYGTYANMTGVFLDGIHGAPYIAAPLGSYGITVDPFSVRLLLSVTHSDCQKILGIPPSNCNLPS